MTRDEAIGLAARAVRAAIKRDVGSGEGVHVVVITKDGYLVIPEDELPEGAAMIHA